MSLHIDCKYVGLNIFYSEEKDWERHTTKQSSPKYIAEGAICDPHFKVIKLLIHGAERITCIRIFS